MRDFKCVRKDDWQKLKPTVHGWGINDVNYKVHATEIISGVCKITWVCPYYTKWKNMIVRAKCKNVKKKYLTYFDVNICEDWKYLSNFIKWVDSQPNRCWKSCDLDKDLLVTGNKEYSPTTTVFVPKTLNCFVTGSDKNRGKFMLGVSFMKRHKTKPYVSRCHNPFTDDSNSEHINYFSTELEAHKAWQAKKHEYACMLADLQEDERVAKALRERYAPDKDWTAR